MDSCVELCWTSKGKQRPLRGNGSPIDSGSSSSSSRENWRFLNLQYVFFCLIRMTRQVNIYIYIHIC